tara:strand:+ start:18 stop:2351 length:2334 start_codon:yes stop_codon:yes gene_type:complete
MANYREQSEKQRLIDSILSEQSIKTKPTRPRPLPAQDCREERQMLQEVSQLSSPEAMLSRLEAYARNNEPCLNMTSSSTRDVVCGDFNGDSIVNILDVIILVNIILTGTGYPDSCHDTVGHGGFNILNVVQMVNYLTGDNPSWPNACTCNEYIYTCEDISFPNGDWFDSWNNLANCDWSTGEMVCPDPHGCDWYANYCDNSPGDCSANGTACEQWGHLEELSQFGYTANEACCVCGGGTTGAVLPSSVEQFGDMYFLLPYTFWLSWSFDNGVTNTGTYITINADGTFTTEGGSTGQYCINGDGAPDACTLASGYNFYLLYDSGTWFGGQLEQTMPVAASTGVGDWSRYIASGDMDLINDNETHGTFTTGRLSVIPEPLAQECNLPYCKEGRFFTAGGSEGNWMIDFTCTYWYNIMESPCPGTDQTFIYIWFDSGTAYVGELRYEIQYSDWSGYGIPYYFFDGDTRGGDIGSYHHLFRHDDSHGKWKIGTLPGAQESYHNHLAGPANSTENSYGWTNGFQQPEGCWKKAINDCGCDYPLTDGTCSAVTNCTSDSSNQYYEEDCCAYWDDTGMSGFYFQCYCDCPDETVSQMCASGSIWGDCSYLHADDCNSHCASWCINNDHMSTCNNMDCVDENYAECKWNLSTMEYLGNDFVPPNQSVDNQVNIWYQWMSGPEYDNGHCVNQNNQYGIPGFCQLEMTLTDDPVLFFGYDVTTGTSTDDFNGIITIKDPDQQCLGHGYYCEDENGNGWCEEDGESSQMHGQEAAMAEGYVICRRIEN